ncbi:hypothetical protein GUJ93_ZPchr0005g14319 [Zizania palustris]|uniref:Uncharacterized protein n=1 Tax=Zizania palustris TaxID=103762 RepID=A0A8J5SXJ7_ZIZPA|nr:hypothetical protein GUJ93_ZPchr0005g14319 [Zizania palustris]
MSPRVSPDMIPAKSTRKQDMPAYAHHPTDPNGVSSPCTSRAVMLTPDAAATRAAAARLADRALPSATAAIAPNPPPMRHRQPEHHRPGPPRPMRWYMDGSEERTTTTSRRGRRRRKAAVGCGCRKPGWQLIGRFPSGHVD